MTQEQLNTIFKVLKNGAPALANELCGCVAKLVEDNAKLLSELASLKNKKTDEGDK